MKSPIGLIKGTKPVYIPLENIQEVGKTFGGNPKIVTSDQKYVFGFGGILNPKWLEDFTNTVNTYKPK
jgi:hypothetical protein